MNINADMVSEMKRFASIGLLAAEAVRDIDRKEWNEPTNNDELANLVNDPPTDTQLGAALVVSVRPDQKGYAGEMGISYETLDRIVTEAQVTHDDLMKKRPAPAFRSTETNEILFKLPDPVIYSLPPPPYNEFSSVPPRTPDGALIDSSVP